MRDDEEYKDQMILMRKIMALQDAAYGGSYGTWWQRWVPGVCKHELIRCTHGDEINARNGRRRVCMVCGRALRGPLPLFCFFSPDKEVHPSYADG